MSVSSISLTDSLLDGIIAARWEPPGTPGRPEPRSALLPEHHLRTLIGLLLLAGPDPFAPLRCEGAELPCYFAPRKRTTDEKAWDPKQLDRSLKWLTGQGFIAKESGWGLRLVPKRLTGGTAPAWAGARELVLATVKDLRLQPAQVAILARAAYYADSEGIVQGAEGSVLSLRELALMVGLTSKTLVRSTVPGERQGHLTQLAGCGPSYGVRELVVSERGPRRPTIVRFALCASTAHVEAPVAPRLHPSWPGASSRPGDPEERALAAAQSAGRANPQHPAAEGTEGQGVLGVCGAQSPSEGEATTAERLKGECERLAPQIWHVDLLAQAINRADEQLPHGEHLPLHRKVSDFLLPVLALEEQYHAEIGGSAVGLLGYALQQTLSSGVLEKPDSRSWHRYLAKVCMNHKSNFSGVARGSTNGAVKARRSPEAISARITARLRDSYQYNKTGDTAAAESCVAPLLANTPLIARALYDGDEHAARCSIIEAFKTGSSDPPRTRVRYPPVDYLPHSTWPHTGRLPFEPDPAPKSAVQAPTGPPIIPDRAS